MPKNKEAQMREEWEKEVAKVDDIGLALVADSVANYWLSKRKLEIEEIVEEVESCIEKLRAISGKTDFGRGGLAMAEEFLSILRKHLDLNSKE